MMLIIKRRSTLPVHVISGRLPRDSYNVVVHFTTSRSRAESIDFSVPYFHSGVSLLASPQTTSEIPLLAFLLPFSPELWIAIFTSLNVTAIAVAIYEWLSPFGLNPWGRQRSKNFSMSSGRYKLYTYFALLAIHASYHPATHE